MCHRLPHDQPQPGSFFQRPREAEKRDPGNEVGVYHFNTGSLVSTPKTIYWYFWSGSYAKE